MWTNLINQSISECIHRPGIAVICNAWEELDDDIHQKSFQVTLDCICNNPGISAVLLAGTHVNLTPQNQGPNEWYSNSKQIFVDEQGVDWVRRLWEPSHCITKPFAHHNPVIRDHNYQGRACIAVWEQWQIEWLLNHYFTDVENVWYFGAGLGVRRDAVGWAQLCDLVRFKHVRPVRILTHRQGMLNNQQNHPNFRQCNFEYINWIETDWQFVSDDILIKTSLEW